MSSYSFPPSASQSQIYLRFKRHNQTVFVPCETTQPLQVVKERLAELMGKDEDDVRLYEHMSDDKRSQVIHSIIEKQKELIKQQKKKSSSSYTVPGQELKLDTPETVQIPPLDCTKKLWELGLDNDHIVMFVYRTNEYEDQWESIFVPGVFIDQRAAAASSAAATSAPAGDSASPSNHVPQGTVPPTPSNQTS